MRTIVLIGLFFLLSNCAFGFPAQVVKNVAYEAKREAKDLYEDVLKTFTGDKKEHQEIRFSCEEFMKISSDYYLYAPNAYRDGSEKVRLIHLAKLNTAANKAFESLQAVNYQSSAVIRSQGSIKTLNDLINEFNKPSEVNPEGNKS